MDGEDIVNDERQTDVMSEIDVIDGKDAAPDAASAEKDDGEKGAYERQRRLHARTLVALAFAAAALVVAVLAVAWLFARASAPSSEVTAIEQACVSVNVSIEGYYDDEDATAVVAAWAGDVSDELADDEAPSPALRAAVPVNSDVELSDLSAAGTYTIAVVSCPELSDGTVFSAPPARVVDFDGQDGLLVTFGLAAMATGADDGAAQAQAAEADDAEEDHEHSWQTVYTVEDAGQTTSTRQQTSYHTVCNTCLEIVDGEAYAHLERTGHAGVTTNVPVVETVSEPADVRDELAAAGEICTVCGATRGVSGE